MLFLDFNLKKNSIKFLFLIEISARFYLSSKEVGVQMPKVNRNLNRKVIEIEHGIVLSLFMPVLLLSVVVFEWVRII